ncbi:TRAP transporter substrate-binding protein [Vibrio sp. TH_r3]|uniref:TRAP transporter substrate-binding protein n=1 Tax=Vibrio sp. TH_r3 TaxID=3082084 RepID=UPI0029535CDC|nr:TRAP transporter substrate-binding protein [Vibrio sp. TH_r3]MDV7105102.1 TRAP transporter substrate-binding protein [Vibrio sp. TH_r3]
MKKHLLVATLIAALLPSFANAEKLIIAGSEAVGSLLDRMSIQLADKIEKYSNGELDVNLIRGNAMGTAPQVIQQQMLGTVDINFTRPEYYSEYVPEFGILSWGLTFDDREHMDKFFASESFSHWNDELISAVNIRILAAGPDQARVMFSTNPVKDVDAINKLKIRVPQITTYLRFWQAMGAQPTQVDWSEVFLSLNSGLVEAAEADYSGAMSQKFHIAAPYITETNHVFSAANISINEQSFQQLSSKNQAVVEKAALEAITWLREEAQIDSNKVKQKMISEGAKVTTIDRLPLIKMSSNAAYEMEKEGLWPKGTWDTIKSVR